MLKIRLTRIGAKKRPFYRVVVKDERSKRDGDYLELLGTYNPLTEPKDIKLKQDRIDHWVKQGAQMSVGFLRIIGKAPQRKPRKPKKERKEEVPPVPAQPAEEKPAETPTAEAAPAEEPKTEEKPTEETQPVEEKPTEEVKAEETPVAKTPTTETEKEEQKNEGSA